MSKKLQEKQRKRLAEQMRREQQRKAARRSNLITIGLAVLILGIVTVAVIMQQGGGDAPEPPQGVTAADAGCDAIQEHPEEGNKHVDPSTDVDYETSPPTSGNHWPTEFLVDPAFYPGAVDEEALVHNLEHGHIVIWYRPDAGGNTITDLEQFTNAVDDDDALPGGAVPPVITVPYDDIPESKSYVITAWTASQACARYSLQAIDDFREKYQGRGPENAGIPTFDGE